MSNHRFPELLKRALAAGKRDANGRVRVAFVVELDEKSTNVDADWSVANGQTFAEGRSGEQAFAALVEKLETEHG